MHLNLLNPYKWWKKCSCLRKCFRFITFCRFVAKHEVSVRKLQSSDFFLFPAFLSMYKQWLSVTRVNVDVRAKENWVIESHFSSGAKSNNFVCRGEICFVTVRWIIPLLDFFALFVSFLPLHRRGWN